MLKIDAHQHFWIFDAIRDSWITDDMHVIRRDFLPHDLQYVLHENGIDGCIAVQADQSEEQNGFLLHLTEGNDFIKGIVGWVDLQAENIEARLEFYSHTRLMKGFRHVLQGESNRALMLEPAFKRGISLLSKYNFTYDILIFPDQLKYAAQLAQEFPQQKFVLDHIAKPDIKSNKIGEWAADIKQLAANKNVYCKVSGMVTEADWHNWTNDTFTKYLDVVFNAFGTERIMFGSDWPVCLVAAEYSAMKAILGGYVQQFTAAEQDMIFGGNAVSFYKL
ncbi:amidohydrolase family protein [Mucilaginibacter boryungensis]|uniref:Amidohydrolase family protein n=1 Tax=Mucilaginibacter boryungensis TaxID=768480 RepID=A0ABR9XN64_9SPHI|nr:amidohydrolase family protein [Mucilaginibacter boryungensis]MBE9668455.1 amidohydrolase family protein [Mucilaginibacter boryungensis]